MGVSTVSTGGGDLWPADGALSPELAALQGQGIPSPTLHEGARLARLWGVTGDEALIASGLVPAETLYRALGRALGLPFLDGPFVVSRHARFPDALLTGVAPLDGVPGRFACAPRGAVFVKLALHWPGRAYGLAITTPERLREAVFASRGEFVARSAAESLPRLRPEDSYYDGVTLRQLAWMMIGTAGLVLLAVGIGGNLRQGLALLFSLPFLGLTTIKVASVLERSSPLLPPARPDRRTPDRDLPVYSVLVPLFRESRVLGQLLGALEALDYPRAKLDLKLLVEAGDRETAEALARIRLPPFAEVLTVPAGQPRTKPRALNVGLALARGRFLVIYDAEDVPDPGQLRAAVATFEAGPPDVACLQARLVIDNTDDGWLTRFFTVEYGALFDVVNPALPLFDLPMPLGGTSNHLRVDVLRELGGWDAWNVTEDADLSVRLATAGYRIGDLPSSTLEEAPSTIRAWMAQRTRWMKGFVQVTITHSRRPIRNLGRLGPVRLFGAAALIFGAVASAVVYPAFTALILVTALRGELLGGGSVTEVLAASLAVTLLCAGALAMILPAAVAIRRRGWGLRLWPYAALMPLYYLMVSAAAWRSLVELALDPDRWNKTEHGLARTSRASAARPTEPS